MQHGLNGRRARSKLGRMLQVLSHPLFSRLFAAQIVALLGTGLLTIALGLLAYDLAGADAGRVLGIALTIKMLAYVGLSPVATALVARMDRRAVLIGADLIRAGAALCLPFVDAVWQIYALIFLLQAASATFTPTFQAVIPDVLPDEADYTSALSLSRLAYEIENILSPVLAGLLLVLIAPSGLFAGTALGFVLSAALVFSRRLPQPGKEPPRPFTERVTRGSRIYLATPRLRGLLALNGTVAAVGAVVIVLSVVVARGVYGGSQSSLAWLLGAYGLGSGVAALALPQLLDRLRDRTVMLAAGSAAAGVMGLAGLAVLAWGWPPWWVVLMLWALVGAGLAAVMTPSGRILRRSARRADRPAVFAAQFALSHACWLVAYPLAGFLGSGAGSGGGAGVGVAWAMAAMGGIGLACAALARKAWPAHTPPAIEHVHDDLPPGHPHLQGARRIGGKWVHSHAFVIDDEHRVWPTNG